MGEVRIHLYSLTIVAGLVPQFLSFIVLVVHLIQDFFVARLFPFSRFIVLLLTFLLFLFSAFFLVSCSLHETSVRIDMLGDVLSLLMLSGIWYSSFFLFFTFLSLFRLFCYKSL